MSDGWLDELDGISASDSDDPLDRIWARLSRPFDVIGTVGALTGLSTASVSQLVGTIVATSPEADRLLQQFPTSVRSLATSIQTHAERCVGSLRGPILWSETMSARASSYGDEGLFVCMAPSRAYDIDENRVLVAALLDVVAAAKEADATIQAGAASGPGGPSAGLGAAYDDTALLLDARRNGHEAARFASHPSLSRVSRKRPSPRAIKRTRSGKHLKSYGPALAMLERTANPVGAADLSGWCDARTRAQHAAFIGLAERLEVLGGRLPAFRVERGALYAGPIQYRHGRGHGESTPRSGILVGDLLIDVPDQLDDANRTRAEEQLRQRARQLQSMVVMDDADLDRAIDRAVELATT